MSKPDAPTGAGFENVVFTDRYGGYLPSALRICSGDCEGMGWTPLERCETCGGSGRCSWFTTLLRIPRWIVKCLTFVRWAMGHGINPPEWSWWKCLCTAIRCSFGADLRSLFR